ncbi:MAG: type II toxin-antitoxin system Phd/YefM family antitoxin [Coriobacteriia bacterium]|nr:type II toxin-antitoxin system Phd/YefM family antitoxin [Coriobacteriia bacterium]
MAIHSDHRGFAGLMDAAGSTHKPIVITQHDRPKAVLQDIDSF